ncbi:MAG: hypothetical protein ACT4QD_04815 [Acidobacteriota bacterium]
MSGASKHPSRDLLIVLATVAGQPPDPHHARTLSHVGSCQACADQLAHLTGTAQALRAELVAHADQEFDERFLVKQQERILDRVSRLGELARVLPFPLRGRVALPGSARSRRWISVAAAAGLIVGLLAGQFVHVVPGSSAPDLSPGVIALAPSRLPALGVGLSGSTPSLSDDELLVEVETAVQIRRASALLALDALTPTSNDFRDPIFGR